MSLATIIELAIGILSVWIVLSFFTVLIQPWISREVQKRASDLELAIQRILVDPILIGQFYDHPIIRGLSADKGRAPSQIPAQQFSLALFDILMKVGTESSLIQRGLYEIRDKIEKYTKTPREQAIIYNKLNELANLALGAAATEAGTSITNISLNLLKEKVVEFSRQYYEYKTVIDRALLDAWVRQDEIERVLRKQRSASQADPAISNLRRGVAALSVINPELSKTLTALMLYVEQYVTPRETSLSRAKKNIEK